MGQAGISLESEAVREGDSRMARQRNEMFQLEDNIIDFELTPPAN